MGFIKSVPLSLSYSIEMYQIPDQLGVNIYNRRILREMVPTTFQGLLHLSTSVIKRKQETTLKRNDGTFGPSPCSA